MITNFKHQNLKNRIRLLLKEKYGFSELKVMDYKAFLTPGIKKDILKLEKDYPLDYLIGHKDFCGLKIDLSYKPLIPRIETEYWVEKEIKKFDNKKPYKILDIYSGSGCIGLAALKYLPNSNVTFADINSNAIKQIKENLKLNKFKKRCKVMKSRTFNKIKGKYDIIFANPPYISNYYVNSMLRFEPKLALYSGAKGLTELERFLSLAYKYTAEDGIILAEIGFGQKLLLEKFLKGLKAYNFRFEKDQFGKYRYLILCHIDHTKGKLKKLLGK